MECKNKVQWGLFLARNSSLIFPGSKSDLRFGGIPVGNKMHSEIHSTEVLTEIHMTSILEVNSADYLFANIAQLAICISISSFASERLRGNFEVKMEIN